MAETEGNMLGAKLSFLDDDDPDLVAAAEEHPAIEHLENAIAALRKDQPVKAATILYDAMSIISERDGVMSEF